MTTNELNEWDKGAPRVTVLGNRDFEFWDNGAPIVEQDEGGDGTYRRVGFVF